MKTNARHIATGIAITAACAALLALPACSSGGVTHEILSSTDSCIQCHSDRSEHADVTPTGATTCNGTVNVTTDKSVVYVCAATSGTEDGSVVIPRQYTTTAVSGGQASVQLGEGTWAVCVETDDGKSNGVLVEVDSSADALDVTLN